MKKLDRYLSIFALVVVAGTPLLNKPVTATEAALTAPAIYDYAYKYDATYGGFLAFGDSTDASVHYTRTVDGVYYNYNYSGNGQNNWPFDVDMTFNRSNTAWTVSPYEPSDTKIGSDATVGTITNKIYLKFDNQTNKDYKLWLDLSSGNRYNTNWDYEVNAVSYDDNNVYYAIADALFLASFPVPAYSTVIFRQSISQNIARYLDAWYLQDLGVSAAYDQGYDDGEVVGYEDGYNNSISPLWDGLEVAVGVTLNFILFIATLSIFDISLLNIGIVLVSILGLVWVLKALRG
jgi:hypothetical protein